MGPHSAQAALSLSICLSPRIRTDKYALATCFSRAAVTVSLLRGTDVFTVC